jgi:hypothetical protein
MSGLGVLGIIKKPDDSVWESSGEEFDAKAEKAIDRGLKCREPVC